MTTNDNIDHLGARIYGRDTAGEADNRGGRVYGHNDDMDDLGARVYGLGDRGAVSHQQATVDDTTPSGGNTTRCAMMMCRKTTTLTLSGRVLRRVVTAAPVSSPPITAISKATIRRAWPVLTIENMTRSQANVDCHHVRIAR